MKRHRWWISFPLVAFATLLLVLSSCTPAWFPDSKTFLSVGPTGETFLHNIETKKTTRLAGLGTSLGQTGVAVAPDGKTIAICTLIHVATPRSIKIQIAIYNAAGKLDSKLSHDFAVDAAPAKPKDGPDMLNVYWSPDSKKLVGFSGASKSAFSWNRESKEFHSYPSALSISRLLAGEAVWIHSFYPCLPDSSGFLVVYKGTPAIQQWDPKKRIEIKTADSAKGFDFRKAAGDESKLGLWLAPYWKGRSLVSPLGENELTIDTDKLEFRIVKSKDLAKVNDFGKANDAVILVRFRNGAMLGMAQKESKQSMMYYGAMHETKKELVKPSKDTGASFTLLPAPNNERVILTQFSEPFQTQVFNENGELDFEYKKYTRPK